MPAHRLITHRRRPWPQLAVVAGGVLAVVVLSAAVPIGSTPDARPVPAAGLLPVTGPVSVTGPVPTTVDPVPTTVDPVPTTVDPVPTTSARSTTAVPSTTAVSAPGRGEPPVTSLCLDGSPLVVGESPRVRVAVCTSADGAVYRGWRALDGATATVPAVADDGSWVATSGSVTYRLGEGELLVSEGGVVLDREVLPRWWQQ